MTSVVCGISVVVDGGGGAGLVAVAGTVSDVSNILKSTWVVDTVVISVMVCVVVIDIVSRVGKFVDS